MTGEDGLNANEEKSFPFKATHAGIYVYHCASPHVTTHITNGMYGIILVKPAEGLSEVDHNLTRAIDKSALAELIIEGEARLELYSPL